MTIKSKSGEYKVEVTNKYVQLYFTTHDGDIEKVFFEKHEYELEAGKIKNRQIEGKTTIGKPNEKPFERKSKNEEAWFGYCNDAVICSVISSENKSVEEFAKNCVAQESDDILKSNLNKLF